MTPKSIEYPTVIEFEGIGPCYYTLGVFARPLKGEYYISGHDGDKLFARQSTEALPEPHRIVRPTFHAIRTTVWALGLPIQKEPGVAPKYNGGMDHSPNSPIPED